MSGMKITDSPWLTEQMARNILSVIQTSDSNKMRIPAPCAIRCQVVSQSLASMSGCDLDIEVGSIRWLPEQDVLVVHDYDWLEMYESHGGMDLDDFFVAYWRLIDGERKVVIMRSPNDYGEYSVFDYVEGDWYPTERVSAGTIEFPPVPTYPGLWPKRLSEAVRDGEIEYLGLPSTRMDPEDSVRRLYNRSDVRAALLNNVDSQTCVGANVNARSLDSDTNRRHRPVQLTTMESCIDTGAQGGCAEDIDAVTTEAHQIVQAIINDPDEAPIDAYLWETRFARILGTPFDPKRIRYDGHMTQIHNFRLRFAEEYMEMVRDFVNNHVAQNLDPRIHELGARYLSRGYDLMTYSRQALVGIQSNNKRRATADDWEAIHTYMLREIDKCGAESDRHDMMLGLLSACHKVPAASTGRVSDQLVMNPALFDPLMAALRYYGIAAHLFINDDGQIERRFTESWELPCTNCDDVGITVNPLEWQSFNARGRICPGCAG